MKIKGEVAREVIEKNSDMTRVWIDGKRIYPEQSRKVKDISEAFTWGYDGSSPRQLALAILLEAPVHSAPGGAGGDLFPLKYYSEFMNEIVTQWKQDEDFEVEVDVDEWLASHLEDDANELRALHKPGKKVIRIVKDGNEWRIQR
jgi:hypothetical protein